MSQHLLSAITILEYLLMVKCNCSFSIVIVLKTTAVNTQLSLETPKWLPHLHSYMDGIETTTIHFQKSNLILMMDF